MPVNENTAIATNTAAVLISVTAKMSRYESLCVSPVTASSVITAPLCGSVSMPPLAIEATRCSTSSGMPAAFALAMKVSAIAASAMLMPPDADPVMPASALMLTASLISGLGMASSVLAISMNPGSAAITPPKPYSDAVFIDASSEPATAALVPSANFAVTGFHANAITVRMPRTRAASTAQIAVALPTSVTIGLAPAVSANSWVLP